MILILFVLLILNAGSAHADLYAIEREDGGVTIYNYNEGSRSSLESEIKELGLFGRPIFKIEKSDMPNEKQKYWKIQNGKILVDEVKKSEDLAKTSEKGAKKAAALAKLKVTEQELKDALGI